MLQALFEVAVCDVYVSGLHSIYVANLHELLPSLWLYILYKLMWPSGLPESSMSRVCEKMDQGIDDINHRQLRGVTLEAEHLFFEQARKWLEL